MAATSALNTQQFDATVAFANAAGAPATVTGAPVWASSDETVLLVVAAADGMSAIIKCVAPGGPARVTVTANADPDPTGAVMMITGVTDDVTVTLDPAALASVVQITLGTPVPKTP